MLHCFLPPKERARRAITPSVPLSREHASWATLTSRGLPLQPMPLRVQKRSTCPVLSPECCPLIVAKRNLIFNGKMIAQCRSEDAASATCPYNVQNDQALGNAGAATRPGAGTVKWYCNARARASCSCPHIPAAATVR